MPAAPAATLRPLTGHPGEIAAIQALFESVPGYFDRVAGAPADATEAMDTFTDLPPGRSRDDKQSWPS